MQVRHPQRQTDMECESHIPALEIFLAVEVGGIRYDPPAAGLAVNVPNVMSRGPDQRLGSLFGVEYSLAILGLHICRDLCRLSFRRTHAPSPPRSGQPAAQPQS